jgi:hypothetical protein
MGLYQMEKLSKKQCLLGSYIPTFSTELLEGQKMGQVPHEQNDIIPSGILRSL